MRCFVAVLPPPGVLDVLARLDRPAAPGVRWTHPDQWHVTLRFLGEVDPGEASAALAGLNAEAVVAAMGPATIVLGGHAWWFRYPASTCWPPPWWPGRPRWESHPRTGPSWGTSPWPV